MGILLTEAGGKYGDKIIDEYSKKLVLEVGKKYNKRTLFRMKQFYIIFSNEKVSPMATQLTWSHYTELLPIKDLNELLYYIKLASTNNLSKRQLREKIKNNEYKRLSLEARNKIMLYPKFFHKNKRRITICACSDLSQSILSIPKS